MAFERQRSSFAAAALVSLTLPAAAHHSAAPFDQQTVVPIEGVVSAYEWKNPHIYIHLDAPDSAGKPVTWVVESGSPAVMRALGWTKESFAIGDRVRMKVSPAKDRSHNVALIRSAETKNGPLAGILGGAPPVGTSAAVSRASGLGGVWVPVVNPVLHQQLRLNPSILPVTPKGAQSLAGFREQSSMNPAARCVPPVAPVVMIIPEVKAVELRGDEIHIRSEGFGAERIVHLNATSHGQAAASLQGHSIGRWEGDVLVVSTERFAENRVGNAIGLASGSRKHLVERFQLNPGGTRLKYSFVLEDPEYLRSPVTGELEWAYRPELNYSEIECDPKNAQRFQTE